MSWIFSFILTVIEVFFIFIIACFFCKFNEPYYIKFEKNIVPEDESIKISYTKLP